MNKQKGFTIIELIVVIGIIAVLAAIVLVNVTQYINKGKDAAVKGNMAGLLTNSAVHFDTNQNYLTFCSTNFVAGKPIFDQTPSAAASKFCYITPTTGAAWAACSQMIVDATKYWCVDSSGTKKEVTGTCSSSFAVAVCP